MQNDNDKQSILDSIHDVKEKLMAAYQKMEQLFQTIKKESEKPVLKRETEQPSLERKYSLKDEEQEQEQAEPVLKPWSIYDAVIIRDPIIKQEMELRAIVPKKSLSNSTTIKCLGEDSHKNAIQQKIDSYVVVDK